jgi:hypothetical protein
MLISYETLLYVGLSKARATELWRRWSNSPHGTDPENSHAGVLEFDDFVLSSFENMPDATDDSTEEWQACLERCGISGDLQHAIMDPQFEYIRLSHSCLYWIRDTVEMRYAGLRDIQKTSRERQMQLQRAASRPSGNQGGSSSDRQRAGLHITTGSPSSSRQNTRSASETQQHHTAGISQHIWGSANATEACKPVPGYTILFRGQDQGRISGLFDEAGNLHHIGTLASRPSTDFSSTQKLFYFAPDYRVAEYYAAYAKRRAACESVVIICLSIPNTAIENLTKPDILHIYWPDDEWKELLWRCCTDADEVPPYLEKYQQATLIIGTVSRRPDRFYCRMSSWRQVTEECLLQVGQQHDSGPCLQYVFSGTQKGRRFLTENGARNMTVFPYPPSALQAWATANPWF